MKLNSCARLLIIGAIVLVTVACDPPTGPSPSDNTQQRRETPTVSPTSSSALGFQGSSSFRVSGGSVAITIRKIVNSSSSHTSGSLRIDLWATANPYRGGNISGYQTASIRTRDIGGLSDQLRPGSSFSDIAVNVGYSAPPSGYANYTLVLAEYDSGCGSLDKYCIAAILPMQ